MCTEVIENLIRINERSKNKTEKVSAEMKILSSIKAAHAPELLNSKPKSGEGLGYIIPVNNGKTHQIVFVERKELLNRGLFPAHPEWYEDEVYKFIKKKNSNWDSSLIDAWEGIPRFRLERTDRGLKCLYGGTKVINNKWKKLIEKSLNVHIDEWQVGDPTDRKHYDLDEKQMNEFLKFGIDPRL